MTDSIASERPPAWTWLLALLLGGISIGAGVILLFEPGNSLKVLAVIAGIFVFVDGLFRIVMAVFGRMEDRGLIAVVGVLDVVVGILLVRHPVQGVTFVAILLGIWLIAAGILRLLTVPFAEGSRLWRAVIGGVLAIAGIVIIAEPNIGYGTLAIVTAIGFMANGVAIIAAELDRHYVHSDVTR